MTSTRPYAQAAVAAGLALLVPLAAPPAASAQDDPAIRALKGQVEDIRGLRFERAVKVERRSESELRDYMTKSFAEEVPEAETALAEAFMKQLGLLDEDADLRKVYLEMLGENVAGFYDPKDGTLWIIDRGGADGPSAAAAAGQDDMVILHELIHALEDQHFDLKSLDEARKGNDDRLLALQLLVEGSATYGMFQPVVGPAAEGADADARRWIFRGLSFTFDLSGAIQPQETPAPDFLMRLLVAPYAEGVKFCGRLAEDGGYEAITAAYAEPPRSTEQVLHPEKYLGAGAADEPVERRLPDLGAAVGPDWRPLGQNTMGELQTRLLFQSWLVDEPASGMLEELPPAARKLGKLVLGLGSRLVPDRDPARAADGWGGDRYQVLHHTLGDTAVVWWTTWDTDADADQFEDALGLARERHPGIAVDRRGREVVVLIDVPEESRAAVLARLRPEVF